MKRTSQARKTTLRALLVLVSAMLAGAWQSTAADTVAQGPHDFRDRNFDYFVTGNPAVPRAGKTQFLLALMGGGGRVDAAFRAIATHAGGGHILILRAVDDDSFDPEDGNYGRSFATTWGPVSSAETITFHNRQASYDPRVLSALRQADGIFIAGGDQANYVRYWKGTPVQQALNAHVRADRPIGGSSAGLAILGHYGYPCLDGISLESKVALADPFNASVMVEEDFMHFRGLEQVITDSHFSARSRLGRTIVFLARINQSKPGSSVIGLGIDEKTALLIDGAGRAQLAAGSAGSAWLVRLAQPALTLARGQPLTLEGIQVVRLGPESVLELKSQAVRQPMARTEISVERGVPSPDELTHAMILRDKVPPGED
ncbi:MAG: cyanophycinase [Proteobacteria bacterium]|nr:cyanophycinase [Pseudomonadota bacterium]